MIQAIRLVLAIGPATVADLADALQCSQRRVWSHLCRNKRLHRHVKRSGDYQHSRNGGPLQPLWMLA